MIISDKDTVVHLDHVGFVPHASYLRHVPHLLLYQRGFEGYQHEESEHAVVPVLIQTPQTNTEHLRRGERERASICTPVERYFAGLVDASASTIVARTVLERIM
jgi:hypothetical protein